jgi:hypothetical protein
MKRGPLSHEGGPFDAERKLVERKLRAPASLEVEAVVLLRSFNSELSIAMLVAAEFLGKAPLRTRRSTSLAEVPNELFA